MGGMDWIDIAQGMERWRLLVNEVMNLWFYSVQWSSWPAEELLASQGLAVWSLTDFFISCSAEVFIGSSAQKINTNIYGCRAKRAMELWCRGPWWHPEEISKTKSRVFRLRSQVSSSGYLHVTPTPHWTISVMVRLTDLKGTRCKDVEWLWCSSE
jgi:hypothetical protein